jgi:hypothetical protein
MLKRPWIFLINTFEVNTRGSNVKMLSIITDTDAKLQNENAVPDILALYNLLHPIYDGYRQICINYDMVEGNYGGGTLAFENLMDTLPTVLRTWEGPIRAVYFEDTPEERAIFPNKRTPFLQGTYEDRLSAIGTLSEKLSSIAVLNSTYLLVSSFYNLALSTRLAQQQGEGALGQVSDLREQQRIVAAQALYGVLGGLMLKFRNDPSQIERFFDLELLRSKAAGQTTGPATINGKVLNAVTLMPVVGARVVLRNTEGEVELFTDANGVFTFTTPELTETIEAELEVSAPLHQTKLLPLVVEPASTQEVEVLLQPGV